MIVEEKCNNETNKACFSRVPKKSSIQCAICDSAIGRSDLYRKSCGHGYHIKCFHESFINDKEIEIHENCHDCRLNNGYCAFLLHVIFVSPDFPDGLTCLPDFDDECKKSIPKLWSMALSEPNTKSLERVIKIRLPTVEFTINGETVDLIEIIAVKATPENLNYILDSGVKLHSSEDVDAANLGFSFALNYFNFENASGFLNHGADINRMFAKSERTLLSWAVHDGLVDVAKFLIENNADVNLANSNDGSPLHLAVLKNDPVMVNLLMKSKLINIKATNKFKRSPCEAAIMADKLVALVALLDNIPVVDIYTREGSSLLQFAAGFGSLESTKLLISRGFKFITRDGIISHSLHFALCSKKTETVKFLLGHGANPYELLMIPQSIVLIKQKFLKFADRLQVTDPPIVIAIISRNFDAFEAFLNTGMNPNTRIFGFSSTLLHLACEVGDIQMAKHLISIGADTLVRDNNYKPPFEYNNQEFYDAVRSS